MQLQEGKAIALGKILVLYEDWNLLELVKMRLEFSGYEVTAVLQEADAIDAVKNQIFDLPKLACRNFPSRFIFPRRKIHTKEIFDHIPSFQKTL